MNELSRYYSGIAGAIWYTEVRNIFCYSKIMIFKYKTFFHIILLNNFLILHILTAQIYHKPKQYEQIREVNRLINLLNISFYGATGKLKLFGRGYKMQIYKSLTLFKLGYSHNIFFYLLPNIKVKFKKKKKKYYSFFSTTHEQLYNILQTFAQMRIPDIYTRKGVYHRKLYL